MAIGGDARVPRTCLLDEICSVDLRGPGSTRRSARAIKFWAPSPWSTLASLRPAQLPVLARDPNLAR